MLSETGARLYRAFNKLQGQAAGFDEELGIPEFVIVGGQSDGKSSLVEALLGFQFNIKDSELGTRRPLLIQMRHAPGVKEPVVRLQEESGSGLGAPIVPTEKVAEVLRQRTATHLRDLSGSGPARMVSSKPMVMVAEFEAAPNIALIDTPGLVMRAREGDDEQYPGDILGMVRELCAPAHRTIVFLQQASVEWTSSVWLDTIMRIDPNLRRTVFVVSKFDNRLREFSVRQDADAFLSAAGVLPEHVRPFFVSLPRENTRSGESGPRSNFLLRLVEAEQDMLHGLEQLEDGGFDERRFGDRVGLSRLRAYLESRLEEAYRRVRPGVISRLRDKAASEAVRLRELQELTESVRDVARLRRKATEGIMHLGREVTLLLVGQTPGPDPAVHGQTAAQEREACVGWLHDVPDMATAHLRLYGKAAFERLMAEFAEVLAEFPCPSTSADQVAILLLARTNDHSGPSTRHWSSTQNTTSPSASVDTPSPAEVQVAALLVRDQARMALTPLLDALSARIRHLVGSTFSIASSGNQRGELDLSPLYRSSVAEAFRTFSDALSAKVGSTLHGLLASAIQGFDANAEVLERYRRQCEAARAQVCIDKRRQSQGRNALATLQESDENDENDGSWSPTRGPRSAVAASRFLLPSPHPKQHQNAGDVDSELNAMTTLPATPFSEVNNNCVQRTPIKIAASKPGTRRNAGAVDDGVEEDARRQEDEADSGLASPARLARARKQARHQTSGHPGRPARGAGAALESAASGDGLLLGAHARVQGLVAEMFGMIKESLLAGPLVCTLREELCVRASDELVQTLLIHVLAHTDEAFTRLVHPAEMLADLEKESLLCETRKAAWDASLSDLCRD